MHSSEDYRSHDTICLGRCFVNFIERFQIKLSSEPSMERNRNYVISIFGGLLFFT